MDGLREEYLKTRQRAVAGLQEERGLSELQAEVLLEDIYFVMDGGAIEDLKNTINRQIGFMPSDELAAVIFAAYMYEINSLK